MQKKGIILGWVGWYRFTSKVIRKKKESKYFSFSAIANLFSRQIQCVYVYKEERHMYKVFVTKKEEKQEE